MQPPSHNAGKDRAVRLFSARAGACVSASRSSSIGGPSTTCSQYCIEHLGGHLVLASGKDGKEVYHLDRPDLVHGFEGERVTITGVLDSKNTHLHVLKIEFESQP